MLPRLSAALLALCVGGLHAVAFAQTAAPRTAPASNCLDAREVAEMRQSDPRTLAIATTGKAYFQIALQRDCPGLDADPHSTLWGREGWICGGGREFVRGAGQDCPITASAAIDVAEYARQSRLADQNGPRTLAPVQVRGNQRPGQRGFRGTTSYCFAPRYMRSWSEDPRGVIVEVSPVHSGGNRYYRVELTESCPMLDRASSISFVSGMDMGIICGNVGDTLVVEKETLTPYVSADNPMLSRPGRTSSGATAARCGVAAVYPKP